MSFIVVPGTVLSKVTLTMELSTVTDEMVGLEAVYMCVCVQDGEEEVYVSCYGISLTSTFPRLVAYHTPLGNM